MSLLDGLISYHKLDEPSGNLVDSHGSSDGTPVGVTHGVAGVIKTAVGFDGINDTITTLADTPYDFERNNPWTVQVWIKVDSSMAADASWGIISKNDETSGRTTGWTTGGTTTVAGDKFRLQMAIQHNNGVTTLQIAVGTDFDLELDTLYHVIFSYDGSEDPSGFSIRVNDVLKSLNTLADTLGAQSILNNTTLLFGRGNDEASPGPGTFHNGIMDEAGIWSRVLTSTEISTLFNSGQGLAYPFSPSEPVSARQDAISAALGSLPEHFTGTATTSADEITFTRTAGHVKVSNLDATNTILVSLDDGQKFWSIGPNTRDDFFGEIARLFIKSNAGTAAYEVIG